MAGISRSTAEAITPVWPSPPMVARHRSGSPASVIVRGMPRLDQGDRRQMLPERADDMVVLAMHVHGHGTADGGETGARQHRRQPALRRHGAGDVAQRGAGLDRQFAAGGVEAQQPVEPGHVDHPSAGIQRGVAIAAPPADRRAFGGQRRQRGGALGAGDLGRGRQRPTPAGK